MKGMGNIQNMLKQAKKMQEKMQQELSEMKIEGSSGGGMVTVILDGNRNLMDIKINPEVVDKEDVTMLQDLISAAFNDAAAKVEEEMSSKLGSLGAGLKIPGLS
jgi:DNA-binding YbaB/EbfC family protein